MYFSILGVASNHQTQKGLFFIIIIIIIIIFIIIIIIINNTLLETGKIYIALQKNHSIIRP